MTRVRRYIAENFKCGKEKVRIKARVTSTSIRDLTSSNCSEHPCDRTATAR